MTSFLPNFGTKLCQLDGKITRIWKVVRDKIDNVITTNSDGTITLGSVVNPISNIIMNSGLYYGTLSGDALSFRTADGRTTRAFSQDGTSKTAMNNTYIGILPDQSYSVMRNSNGRLISILSSDGVNDGLYTCNGIGWDGNIYESFEVFVSEVFPQIEYNLPPPSDLVVEADSRILRR